jgi:hypothetical protein
MTLETDELYISFVDTFEYRWDSDYPENHLSVCYFFHPVTAGGPKPLGSLMTGIQSNPNGKLWAMVVESKPGSDALKPPVDYDYVWNSFGGPAGYYREGSFWNPVPPEGYKALGTVAQRGYSKPSLDAVVCIREDLTVPGEKGTQPFMGRSAGWIACRGYYINPPEAGPHDSCYAPAGTFVAAETDPGPPSFPVLHVPRIALPMLAEAPPQNFSPQLTGYDEPPLYTAPTLAKEVLVPWTILRDSVLPDTERLHTSPFYRLERQVVYERCLHEINNTGVLQPYEVLWTKGITNSESETRCRRSGVAISVETGVSCGTGGFGAEMKVGVTVSRELGYERTCEIEEFSSEQVKATCHAGPFKTVAMWRKLNRFVLRRHNGTNLEPICTWEIRTRSFANDEYPDD